MALTIGDNFKYQANKPNFERDSFATLEAMKAYPETSIDDGHLSYCTETNKHYKFLSSNTVDETTGKWREFETDASISEDGVTGQVLTKTDDGYEWQDPQGSQEPQETRIVLNEFSERKFFGEFSKVTGASAIGWAGALFIDDFSSSEYRDFYCCMTYGQGIVIRHTYKTGAYEYLNSFMVDSSTTSSSYNITNKMNSGGWGKYYNNSELPLAYISRCSPNASYIHTYYAYKINRSVTPFKFEKVLTIKYGGSKLAAITSDITIDAEKKYLYVHGYKSGSADAITGTSIVMVFNLPEPGNSDTITLNDSDILWEFEFFVNEAAQDLCVSGGRLYYPYGSKSVHGLAVVDTKTGEILQNLDLANISTNFISNPEPEGVALSNGNLYLNYHHADTNSNEVCLVEFPLQGVKESLKVPTIQSENSVNIPNATQSTAGLMSAEDKTKLDSVSNNANNYTHPAGSAASKSLSLYKISTDSTSHVQSVSAVTKSDITSLGIPAQDTTYNNATSTASGLMSASDKEKLDSINVDNAAINVVADARALKGATMRFSGFVNGVTITQTGVNEWDSVVYDTSINKFLAKKGTLSPTYHSVWQSMDAYMSDEVGTSILKDKLYICGEDVYVWSDTKGTLIKTDKEILKDDVPVEGSNNLVKSSGISLATRYSKKEINNLELLYANKYLSNGSLYDGNNYKLYYLDISDYTDEIISINGTTQVYYSLWGLAKKDGDNIEIIHTSESRLSSATINLSEYKIYGANTLLVCNNRNLVVLRDHYNSITNQLSSSINNGTVQTYAPINTIFNIGNANVGDVIDMTHITLYDGRHNITSTVCDCEEGEVFYVTSKDYSNSNYSGHHIVILDDNNAVVWRPYNNIGFDNYKIIIPQNGKKIIATNTITKIEKQTAYKNKEVYADYYGERLDVFLKNGRIGGISDSITSLSIGDTIESLTITAHYSYYRAFCCYCKEGDFFTYAAKNTVPTICVAFFDENLRLLKKEYAYNSNVHLSVAPAQSAICYMWFTYASDNQGTAINTTFDVLKNSDKASFNYWGTVNKNSGDLLNNQVEAIKSILRENSYSMLNSSLENYLAISHRGYMSEAPENTLPGYKCAKQHGFDYSETDILFTSDNVPVCIHDDTINRTALNADGTVISDTIRVDSLTLAEIEQYDFSRITKNSNPKYPFTKIPTLKEFLTLCRNIGIHPYIELKGAFSTEQVNIICDAVREVGLIGKVTYISYFADNLKLVKDNYPVCRLGLLSDSTDQTKINTAAALKNEYNYVFLNINYSFLTQSVVTMCKTAGIRLETWVTASSSNETAEKILALDPYINGVTANALNAKTIIYEGNIN